MLDPRYRIPSFGKGTEMICISSSHMIDWRIGASAIYPEQRIQKPVASERFETLQNPTWEPALFDPVGITRPSISCLFRSKNITPQRNGIQRGIRVTLYPIPTRCFPSSMRLTTWTHSLLCLGFQQMALL